MRESRVDWEDVCFSFTRDMSNQTGGGCDTPTTHLGTSNDHNSAPRRATELISSAVDKIDGAGARELPPDGF